MKPEQRPRQSREPKMNAGLGGSKGKSTLLPCLHCGKPFRVYAYLLKRAGGKFCTTQCYNHARRQFKTRYTRRHDEQQNTPP
jgi:hypothetical protein